MSNNVEFDVDKIEYRRPGAPGSMGGSGGAEPKMVQWLMKKGIVKSPNGAQGILIAVVIINIIITYTVITYFL